LDLDFIKISKLYKHLIFVSIHSIGQSGDGIGGILSIIGSGLVSGVSSGDQQSDEVAAPTPNTLVSILMTNSNTESLDKCIDNLQATNFPQPKVGLGLLDLNKNVQDHMKDQFNFVVGCDCAQNSVSQLAKTVAHSLKRSRQGSFVYIGSEHEKSSMDDLVSALGESYQMNTIVKEIVLERIHLAPLVSDSIDDVHVKTKVEIESKVGGLVAYMNVDISRYTAIVGYHDEVEKEVRNIEKSEKNFCEDIYLLS
jgi:hypothetical protein